ncbi:MAG: restriction endonuclease subunit S [Bacteroidetes bacterium SB0668_bin_1]|nr:restriction endonuclease subunit S [Bacteroidetes bacterium SB0668_bin_1]
MKILLKNSKELQSAGRWDIDFHLPPEGILKFSKSLLRRVDQVADIVKDKRDPTREPDKGFRYIDISSVDVAIGVVTNPQDIEGSEAPSRARKVVRAFDLVVSTCRPTRGAIAVVPVKLHDQIASTAFSIVRAHDDVNPFYLHYALRLPSTLEQFRKWSTGSSYPAILDSDVKKTIIPVPTIEEQDAIAAKVVAALREYRKAIRVANRDWSKALEEITGSLSGQQAYRPTAVIEEELDAVLLTDVQARLAELPPIST